MMTAESLKQEKHPPRSEAHIVAAQAVLQAKQMLEQATKALDEALVPTASFEKELPAGGPSPMAAVLQAREQLANAHRTISTVVEYGLEAPRFAVEQQRIGQILGAGIGYAQTAR